MYRGHCKARELSAMRRMKEDEGQDKLSAVFWGVDVRKAFPGCSSSTCLKLIPSQILRFQFRLTNRIIGTRLRCNG